MGFTVDLGRYAIENCCLELLGCSKSFVVLQVALDLNILLPCLLKALLRKGLCLIKVPLLSLHQNLIY